MINCAAWSNVDGAEDDERGAMAINDTGAALLAAGAARVGASILYPSSDYVFDGTKSTPYLEDDMPAPIGAYGRSKLGGEVSVAAANSKHFIVRSSWLFGLGGKNFVETMLRIGGEQEEVLVVSDQLGCPTSCADLAEGMLELIGTDNYGIHHIVGERPLQLVRLRDRDLRPGRARDAGDVGDDGDDGPQGAPPRLLGARPRSRRRDRAAALAACAAPLSRRPRADRLISSVGVPFAARRRSDWLPG